MKRWLSVSLACAPLLAWIGPAIAQAPKPWAHLILSVEPIKAAPKADADLRPNALRPNVERELLTYVQNDTTATQSVTVQLLAGDLPVASQTKKIVPGNPVRIDWPTGPMAPGGKPLAPTELTRPAVFRLLDDKGKQIGKDIPLEVDRPADYLQATLQFIPSKGNEKNRLIAKVKPTAQFKGPKCPVELVLDPQRIPGYIVGQKRKGKTIGNVTVENYRESRSLVLDARDIRLTPDERKSVVTLRADGYSRAFTFKTTLPRSGTPPMSDSITTKSLHLNVAEAADPRKPVRVGIEADYLENPKGARLLLEVGSVPEGESEAKEFSLLEEFRGERSVKLFFRTGGARGGLLFKPVVEDWIAQVDLKGLNGPTTLRLREVDAETGKKTLIEASKTIRLDDSKPELVAFEKLPAQAVRGKPIVLSARGTDEESGIHDVLFLLGKLPADGALPPSAVFAPGKPFKKDGNIWTGELLVPEDQAGPLDVTVRFTNQAGLSATAVARLPVIGPPAGKKGGKGSIAGVIYEGDRTQRNIPVELLNSAGKVVKTMKTPPGGAFEFKDLDAGDYKVSAVKTSSRTKGVKPVTLGEGEKKEKVEIKLYR